MKIITLPNGQQVAAVVMVDAQGRVLTPNCVMDSTGVYSFDLASLPKARTYDGSKNVLTITYGPDLDGRKVVLTNTWNPDSTLAAESAYVLTGTQANSLVLSGANAAVVGNASGDITVTVQPAGSYFSPFKFTPSDGGAGGTFNPPSVALSFGARSAKFKYTPAAEGNKALSGAVDQGGLAVATALNLMAVAPGKALAPPLVLAEASGTAVTVSWQFVPDTGNGGSPVRNYLVKLTDGSSKLVAASQSSYTFQGLAPNVTVRGSVAAVTDTGLGATVTSNAVTPDANRGNSVLLTAVNSAPVGASAI